MTKRSWISCLLVGCMTMAISTSAFAQAKKMEEPLVVPKGDNLVEVTVVGQGMTKDDAERDAKRKAIERGAGSIIDSRSEVKDFVLIKDTVIARSTGFVQGYEVISAKQQEDDVWVVKIKCTVSVKGIEDMWGTVQNLLKERGRPKIMVFVNEKIGEKVAEDSTVGTKIEDLLLKSGFLLVDKKQMKDIDRKDMESAAADDKPEKMQAIAKKFGAQIFITGSCDAAAGERSSVQGIMLHRYGARGNIRVFNSDDAGMLASKNDNAYSVDRMPNVAADKSLVALGDKIAPQVQNEILRVWLDAMTGGGSVKLEIDNITLKQANAIAETLKGIKEIKDVPDPEFHNKVAEFNIQCTTTAKDLAKKISNAVDKLEITDVSQNVIKATYTTGN
jgi:hypothetical protein